MGGGTAGGCALCGAVGLGAAVAGGGEASLATFRPGGGVVGSLPPDRSEWVDVAYPAEPAESIDRCILPSLTRDPRQAGQEEERNEGRDTPGLDEHDRQEGQAMLTERRWRSREPD